ncbi:DMT family transporter [Pseudonocardia pini]|uniref:DMT family transporter n=1 Tax=Pseudonocardia pini TaxID=2758030 RepID=UPI001FEB3823|nr:DMT family transporter [Pseudonocardia pini]
MSMDGEMLIAVPAAVLGAAGFGLATAAQQRATHEVETTGTLNPRLITTLLRRPMWLLGLLATIVALVLQLVALAFGAIAVVQPLLVTGVVFAAAFSSLMSRRRPDPLILLGALLCAAGVAAFLLLARPLPSEEEHIDMWAGMPLAIGLAAVVVACLLFSSTVQHQSRVLALALATGILYGVTAGLMKVLTGQLRIGLLEPFQHVTLYAVCIVGPIGFLLSQNTFQQGRLVSPAVAVITSVDPVVAVLIGVFWLGERLDSSPALLAGQCLAAVVVIAGIAFITVRGTHLLHELDAEHAAAGRTRPDVAPG